MSPGSARTVEVVMTKIAKLIGPRGGKDGCSRGMVCLREKTPKDTVFFAKGVIDSGDIIVEDRGCGIVGDKVDFPRSCSRNVRNRVECGQLRANRIELVLWNDVA